MRPVTITGLGISVQIFETLGYMMNMRIANEEPINNENTVKKARISEFGYVFFPVKYVMDVPSPKCPNDAIRDAAITVRP